MDGAIAVGVMVVGIIGDGIAVGDGAADFMASAGRIIMAITAIIRGTIIIRAIITAAITVARTITAIAGGITVVGATAIGVMRAGDTADTGATAATEVVATDKRQRSSANLSRPF